MGSRKESAARPESEAASDGAINTAGRLTTATLVKRSDHGYAKFYVEVPSGPKSAMTTLYVRDGESFRAAPPQLIIQRAQGLIAQRFRAGSPVLAGSDRVREFLQLRMGGLEYESFSVLFLDSRLHLIEYVELFRGTVDGADVPPREVVKEALARNAAAVILAHNHPSGSSTPSDGDREVTSRLEEALSLVGIRVIDHLVVGETITSFAERGLI